MPHTRHSNVHSSFLSNATATTEIYTLSLHDALPISIAVRESSDTAMARRAPESTRAADAGTSRSQIPILSSAAADPEEHTSELQSRLHLVCRLLLEKKKKIYLHSHPHYKSMQHTSPP